MWRSSPCGLPSSSRCGYAATTTTRRGASSVTGSRWAPSHASRMTLMSPRAQRRDVAASSWLQPPPWAPWPPPAGSRDSCPASSPSSCGSPCSPTFPLPCLPSVVQRVCPRSALSMSGVARGVPSDPIDLLETFPRTRRRRCRWRALACRLPHGKRSSTRPRDVQPAGVVSRPVRGRPRPTGPRPPGAVAQSGSAPRSHRGGQGFKSPQLHTPLNRPSGPSSRGASWEFPQRRLPRRVDHRDSRPPPP